MLVISVIVALAILAVLLNILGGINFGQNDPTKVMHDALQGIQNKGFGITPPQQITLPANSVILKKQILSGDIPITVADLAFVCTSDVCSGPGPGTTGTVVSMTGTTARPSGCSGNPCITTTPSANYGDTLTVAQKIQVYMVVCGNANPTGAAGGVATYCVALSRSGATATGICQTAWQVT